MSAHESLEVFAHRPDDLTTDVAGLRAGKPGHDGRTHRRILGIEFVLGALRFRYAGSMSGYLARSALRWAHRACGVALVGVEQDVFGLRAPPRGTALQVRQWTCPTRSATHDRDHNAAKFILAAGRAERMNACGGKTADLAAELATAPPHWLRMVLPSS
jgi:hypothetical protein